MIRTLVIRSLVAAFVAGAFLAPDGALARGFAHAEIGVAELPAEARELLGEIKAGGPFRYERDGVVFGNRERRLPPEPRGHYHEYTVPTPEAKTRGARRIVCGGPPKAPAACYYTGDHYRTFARIRE
jgi:ribonuclease T1